MGDPVPDQLKCFIFSESRRCKDRKEKFESAETSNLDQNFPGDGVSFAQRIVFLQLMRTRNIVE